MARTYDSSRRVQAAQRTREAILAAAFRLHGLGVLDMESLAQEADVSVATVRKHFPTRELLFESCTEFGMHLVPLPDVPAIASTPDAAARTRLAVEQLFTAHEALTGQMWSAYRLEDESPALAAVLSKVEDLTELVAGLVVEAWPLDEGRVKETRGFVVGLLNPLTYRALRRYGGLTPEQAIRQTQATLLHALAGAEGRASDE